MVSGDRWLHKNTRFLPENLGKGSIDKSGRLSDSIQIEYVDGQTYNCETGQFAGFFEWTAAWYVYT